jgi:hypothetical protein
LVYWREFPSAFKLDGAESWAEHCKALTTSDAIVEKAVAAIGSYGDTLRMICDGDYSGSDITQLVTDVAALTARLDTKNAKAATSAGAAFAEPIGKLASALAQKYAEGEMAKIVAAADPAVQNLLAGLQKYLEAIGAEQADAERKLAQILHDVDKLVKADNPVDVLALYDLAGRSTAELEAMRTAQSSMLDALKKLAAAQGRLASANGENDSPKLKEVLGLAAEVLNDIAAVNNALKGGGKS